MKKTIFSIILFLCSTTLTNNLHASENYSLIGNLKEDFTYTAFKSFIVANTIGTVAKIGIGRARPYTEAMSESYTPFSTDSAHAAMPSGHTISAFSIASVFADEYDNNPAVGAAAYGLASMVALQRIYEDAHWASDVFAGAALGTVVGKSIVYLHRDKKMENVYIVPISAPSEGKYGAAAVIRF